MQPTELSRHLKIAGILLALAAPAGWELTVQVLHRPPEEFIESSEYPTVPLAVVANGHWVRPRAELTGTVTLVRHEADGDWHFRLTDGPSFVVCEIVPEKPMPPPKLGAKITVRGIVRYDGQHRWWELHPVMEYGGNLGEEN